MASDDSEPAQAVHDLGSILPACHIKKLKFQTGTSRIGGNKACLTLLRGQNLPYLERLSVGDSTLSLITVLEVLSGFPLLDQLELSLAHFMVYDRTTSLQYRPVHVKRLHIIVDLSRNLPHRELADVCAGVKELKLIIYSKEGAEPVSELLKSWDAELDCFHVHVHTNSGFLRKSPCLLAGQVPHSFFESCKARDALNLCHLRGAKGMQIGSPDIGKPSLPRKC
jgi:hypothetical protein